MRLLILASTFPASDTDEAPAFVRDQAVALKAAYPDLRITVLAPHHHPSRTAAFTRHEHFDEYRFHYLWPRRLEQLAGRGIMATLQRSRLYYLAIPPLIAAELWATIRLARRLSVERIYAHWFTPQGVVAWIAARTLRIPFVYTSHSTDVSILRRVPLVGPWIVRLASRDAAAITVVSRRSLDKLRGFFGRDAWAPIAAKTKIIPMGVHLDDARRPSLAVDRAAPIVFIGRLVEKKGLQYLLPAYAALRREMPDAPPLVVAGDGPWRARLQAQAADLRITGPAISFPGYVAGEAKRNLLEAATLVVVPSTVASDGDAEGLPVALLEGLAAGRICIATRESGADDILDDGVNGFLVDHRDVDGLAAALRNGLGLDAARRKAISAAARATAAGFAWPVVARAHYEHLLTDREAS